MKNNIFVLVIFYTVQFFLVSCSQNRSGSNIQADWLEIETPTWSIQFPPSWSSDTSGSHGTYLILAGQPEGEEDTYYETIILASAQISPTINTLELFTNANIDMLKSNMGNWELEESQAVQLANKDAHRLVYTGTNGVIDSRWDQYFIIENNIAWIITFSSEQRRWSEIHPEANTIINSLRLN
ncbi:MAG: hypothetical protein ACI959_001930 [Limisphaerales bacterium]|jgi:hypothetical protein